jgi:hypothetical protein
VLVLEMVLEIIKRDYFYKLHEVTFGFKRLWKIIFLRISYKLWVCLAKATVAETGAGAGDGAAAGDYKKRLFL